MKNLIYVFVLFSSVTFADSMSDQLNALDNAQNQIIADQNARANAAYVAQQEENRRAANAAMMQQIADRKIQEIANKERAVEKAAALARAKEAADRAAAAEAVAAEERRVEKARMQAQEDEERAYQIRASELKLQEAQAEADEKTADADLKKAITAAKLKRVNEEVDLQHKRESSSIDVIQSEADATRNISSGAGEMLSGLGSKGKYELYAVIGLILLALVILIGGWLFYSNSRKAKTELKPKDKFEAIKEDHIDQKEDHIDPVINFPHK
jgi:thiol:disulfide interchange protein